MQESKTSPSSVAGKFLASVRAKGLYNFPERRRFYLPETNLLNDILSRKELKFPLPVVGQLQRYWPSKSRVNVWCGGVDRQPCAG